MGKEKNAKKDSFFITGIPGIDNQHDELIIMCKALQNRIEDKKTSPEFIDLSIQDIMGRFRSHYATEENLMEMIGFPAAQEHKAEHKKIFGKLAKKLKAHQENEKTDLSRFVSSFREEISEHIAVSDRKYAQHIEKLIALKKKFKITALKAQILAK